MLMIYKLNFNNQLQCHYTEIHYNSKDNAYFLFQCRLMKNTSKLIKTQTVVSYGLSFQQSPHKTQGLSTICMPIQVVHKLTCFAL